MDTSNTTQVIDMTNKDTRNKVHMLQCYFALKLQAQTGLTHSKGSVINLVRKQYGVKSKTAVGARDEMYQQLLDMGHVFVTKQQ